jgi:hypothetical protein
MKVSQLLKLLKQLGKILAKAAPVLQALAESIRPRPRPKPKR